MKPFLIANNCVILYFLADMKTIIIYLLFIYLEKNEENEEKD